MKKTIILAFFSLLVVISCKHQPPLVPTNPTNPNNPPTGGGGCDPDTVYFQNDILPIFQTNCAKSGCHNAASHREGIILTDYNNIISTGEIIGGNPNHGDIYQSITSSSSSDVMPPPPDAPLTADQIAKILKWINQGAKNNYCDDGCDTIDVKYSNQVKTLLSNKCVGCHNSASTGGGINLDTYAGASTVALNGRLIGSVSHSTGYIQMPQGGSKLSDCEIKIFQLWIDAGAPNN